MNSNRLIIVLLIAVGGAVGSVARYGTAMLLITPTERTQFPWGTLAVNLLGCLLIGYVNGLLDDRLIRPEFRYLLAIGFLGGYTTFSTFGSEVGGYLRSHQHATAIIYILVSNVAGVLLVLGGYGLSRLHHH
jgi:fluoride exporter